MVRTKRTFYMEKEDEEGWSWPLSEFQDRLIGGEKEIILCEMKRDIGGPMWCKEDIEFIDETGICGRDCRNYKPCNGISGRCSWLVNGFVETGRKFILTKDGLKESKS